MKVEIYTKELKAEHDPYRAFATSSNPNPDEITVYLMDDSDSEVVAHMNNEQRLNLIEQLIAAAPPREEKGFVFKASLRLEVGQQVRLRRNVERAQNFTARGQSLGTVVEINEGTLSVKMDDLIEGCEEWDNCVIWDANHHLTWEDFHLDVLTDVEPIVTEKR